jgi:signal transduction histidine kinase/DNA-binding response OmpR family regulator
MAGGQADIKRAVDHRAGRRVRPLPRQKQPQVYQPSLALSASEGENVSSVRFLGREAKPAGSSPHPTSGDQRPAARAPRRIIGRLKFEVAFFLLLVATFAAVQYQGLIVDQKIEFGPDSVNFNEYSYNDAGNGGTSVVTVDPKRKLKWNCQLGSGFAYPFCGYGLMFDTSGTNKGFDFSGLRTVNIAISYNGPAKALRIGLKNHDQRYVAAGATDPAKPNEIEVPIMQGRQNIVFDTKDFVVPQWWITNSKTPDELSAPEFHNVTAIELQPGTGSPLGNHEFRVDSITFQGSYVSQASWYLIILGLWVVVTGVFLLYRAMTLRKEYEARHRAQVEERQQLEIARDQAEKARLAAESASRAKSEFLANMSHELRTPLNAILGYAQLLERAKLSDQHKSAITTIHRSGQHLLMLITDILDLSKIEAGKLELCALPVDLKSCIDGVADMIRIRAEEKGLRFVCALPDDLTPYVMGDEKRLRQILINLLSNAVRYTPRGEVRLTVSTLPGRGDRRAVRFEVGDTGIGIAEDQHELIFQPFEQAGDAQRRAGGTGLGLSISAKLVELMHGRLRVDSRLGEGSRFWFDLEVEAAHPAAVLPEAASELRLSGDRRKVLVVDDTEANRAVLWDTLGQLGLEVSEARNGAEALSAAQADRPDLILMDLRMPVMDGFEATRKIRAIASLKTVPIVAVSASATQEVRDESLAAGADDFLAKPVLYEELVETLARHLGRTPSEDVPEPREEEMIPPPQDRMEILLNLAMAGNMRAIRAQANEIAAMDGRYRPFAETLLKLAGNYQSPAILNLIESCQRREAA